MGAEHRVVDRAPATLPLMLKAVLPMPRRGSNLPDLTLTRHDVAVDRAHLAAYSEVCGFPLKETVPVTYPHLLAFGLHLGILTDSSFPFPALGTVHVANSLTAHRPIAATERLRVSARPARLRAHPKGRAFDLLTTVHSGGELVWEETSTFLRVGRRDASAPAGDLDGLEQPAAGGTTWRLAGDLGRRYAAVSGDHNPIHLYPLTAKPFGFPRQIAHGMWSKARCLAALDGRLPEAVTVDVAFKKPVLLPGTVAFASSRSGDGYTFALSRPTDDAPHLLGRLG